MKNEALFRGVNRRIYCLYPNQMRRFKKHHDYWPNPALPRTYHDKMLWRKLFDRNPLFKIFTHKLSSKDFSKSRVPDLKIPETYWRGKSVDEIPDSLFEKNFFIKSAHSCGRNLRHFAVAHHEIPTARKRLKSLTRSWMRHTYGRQYYQWAYLEIEHEIFVEEVIETDDPLGLLEINVRCTDGVAGLWTIIRSNKTENETTAYYDSEGYRLNPEAPNIEDTRDFVATESDSKLFPSPPPFFPEVVRISESLSKGVDYARFDFLCNKSCLYGGEITVYPAAGMKRSSFPRAFNERHFDSFWDIRKSWFLTTPQEGWRGEYVAALLQNINESSWIRPIG